MTFAQNTSIWIVQALRALRTQLLASQVGGLSQCRYDESCGDYLTRQIKNRGPTAGFFLGIKRVFSCQGLI